MRQTWVHHSTPEPIQQYKLWTMKGESTPKTIPRAGKVMVTDWGGGNNPH